MKTPLEILQKYWKHSQFREPQEAIINSVLNGENCIVLLPTSGGKSICYQVPALLLEGICIVISPLIALIKDQVNSLQEKNIKAIALTSQLSQDEIVIAFDNLQFGGIKFLYLSPEKLQSKFIQEKIKQLNVSLIAIDEAHCISEWGHDFRPSYLELKLLKELQPKASVIALTATATQKVLDDIQQNLEIENAQIFKKSFKRNNLAFHIITTEDIYGKLRQVLSRFNESTIVYTNNRKQTKEVSKFLNRNGFKSSFYHGGLSNDEKNNAFNSWMQDETPIMVATNAFGMGIDKPNVRAVIHINTPNSLENFIQEAGRAGRDGKNSYSVLLTNKASLFETENKFVSNIATVKFIKTIYSHLNQFYSVSIGETPVESVNFSLQEFCVKYQLNLLQTYNALKILERESIILLDENYTRKSTIRFTVGNQQLFNFIENTPSKESLIQLILRSYGGVFEHFTVINEYVISKKLNLRKKEVINQLKELNDLGILNYAYADTTSKLTFLVIREDDYTINRISKSINQQNELKFEKLKSVIQFIENNQVCRTTQLLSYFNERTTEPCGKCDVCLASKAKKTPIKDIVFQLTEALKKEPMSSQQLSNILNFPENEILNTLKILLEKNKITITSQNKFKLNL
ncbi:RecQ family ATP-dependent DNA helicase [Lutibacter sp. HS1-25]|uniref:RecQ family ATP-dependent DNA helicase n=1 Tax=Lutibacter sp. HS1-25 TaxID=2485000 RepID=UPI001011F0A2|nr:ATP-dependent DNA helicase RecQ [Lutibacter sp. HS1-25]RXP57634.1 RecQ family ATP-dependent DNA helicase [Lutibacter sp. HS1-25]